MRKIYLYLLAEIPMVALLLFAGVAFAEWDGTADTTFISYQPLDSTTSGWDGTADTTFISFQPLADQPVQTPVCTPTFTVVDKYPQCGGTVGLFDRDSSHVFEVTKLRNSCSGEETFDSRDVGIQENRREYPQCGGTVGLEGKDPTHTFMVTEFTNVCSGTRRWDQSPRDLGNLGQCQVTAPPAPAAGGSQSPSAPIVIVVTPTQAPTAIPTRAPTIAPVPTVAAINVDAEIRCPDGFVRTISGSNIICMQQIQNQSVVNTANASTGPITVSLAGIPQGAPIQVVPVEVKQPVVITQELPKTGLPLVAWAFSGLAPLGLKLKRFGSTKAEGNSILALWQEREFLRN